MSTETQARGWVSDLSQNGYGSEGGREEERGREEEARSLLGVPRHSHWATSDPTWYEMRCRAKEDEEEEEVVQEGKVKGSSGLRTTDGFEMCENAQLLKAFQY